MEPAGLWRFLLPGYLVTVAIETPVLLAGLSRAHPISRRLIAGLWLTACTYPVVVLVLPPLLHPERSRLAYLVVAETFAPVAECLLFAAAFYRLGDPPRSARLRDMAAILGANLLSFGIGELLWSTGIDPILLLGLSWLTIKAGLFWLAAFLIIRAARKHQPRYPNEQLLPLRGRWLNYGCAGALIGGGILSLTTAWYVFQVLYLIR